MVGIKYISIKVIPESCEVFDGLDEYFRWLLNDPRVCLIASCEATPGGSGTSQNWWKMFPPGLFLI